MLVLLSQLGLAPGMFVDQAGQKHYGARLGKAEDFGKLLYALAVTYGLQRARQLVVLGDGAAWIWQLIAEHFPGAVTIVDIWHAREHVWKVVPQEHTFPAGYFHRFSLPIHTSWTGFLTSVNRYQQVFLVRSTLLDNPSCEGLERR